MLLWVPALMQWIHFATFSSFTKQNFVTRDQQKKNKEMQCGADKTVRGLKVEHSWEL